MSDTDIREVYAGHGQDRAMGYKYRARICTKVVGGHKRWIFFGPNTEQRIQYSYVIERRFISWSDYWHSKRWFDTKEEAKEAANKWLDKKSSCPKGEYV